MGTVGVVIARFQVPELHEGHKDIIDMAVKENDKILIILGNSPLINTMLDPLDYHTRMKMVMSYYPDAIITFVRNQETHQKWSEIVDKTIHEICPLDTPTLYGGRNSFIPAYHGKYKCVEVKSFHECSGTELREAAGKVVLDTPDFRKGIIYSAYNRHPNLRVTVDMAVTRSGKELGAPLKILLGKKPNSDFWRLPGGFVDIKDESFAQAAERELVEETGVYDTTAPTTVGSMRIEDWRYEGVDGEYIMTNLFHYDFITGDPVAGDDLETVDWFLFPDVRDGKVNLVKCHEVLIKSLDEHFNK